MRTHHHTAERLQDTNCCRMRVFAPRYKIVAIVWNTVPSRRSCSRLAHQESLAMLIWMDLNFRLWLHRHPVDLALYGCKIHRYRWSRYGSYCLWL